MLARNRKNSLGLKTELLSHNTLIFARSCFEQINFPSKIKKRV